MKIMISLTSITLHTHPDRSITLNPHFLYNTLPIPRMFDCISLMKTGTEKSLLRLLHVELHTAETLRHRGRSLSLGNRRIIRAVCFTKIEHVNMPSVHTSKTLIERLRSFTTHTSSACATSPSKGQISARQECDSETEKHTRGLSFLT